MLLEGNFQSLGSGVAENWLYWIAKMEAAIGAATHAAHDRSRRQEAIASAASTTQPAVAQVGLVVDLEGSICFRKNIDGGR